PYNSVTPPSGHCRSITPCSLRANTENHPCPSACLISTARHRCPSPLLVARLGCLLPSSAPPPISTARTPSPALSTNSRISDSHKVKRVTSSGTNQTTPARTPAAHLLPSPGNKLATAAHQGTGHRASLAAQHLRPPPPEAAGGGRARGSRPEELLHCWRSSAG
uniref:Uncharacterized protein n=1 Tax=Oryza glumipatula TaxID=40148 RepID=A0A0E0BRH6_9ORYZ